MIFSSREEPAGGTSSGTWLIAHDLLLKGGACWRHIIRLGTPRTRLVVLTREIDPEATPMTRTLRPEVW
jgi:hypothetical protein